MAYRSVAPEDGTVARVVRRSSSRYYIYSSNSDHLRSHPTENDASLLAENVSTTCRICWEQADNGQNGGAFISPCKCTGSLKNVHKSCIQKWIMIQKDGKGPAAAYHCDICKSRLILPPDMKLRPPPFLELRHFANTTWHRVEASRAGPALSVFLTSSWIFSLFGAFMGACQQTAQLPTLLLKARNDPLTALRPLLGRVAIAVVLEPLVSTQDFLFHLETVLFYAAGWLLDATARVVDANLVSALPAHFQPAFHAALFIPKAIGLSFQALDLAVMCLFGGGASGFVHGALKCLSSPFEMVSIAAKAGAGLLGALAVCLSHGARGAAAAANMVSPRGGGRRTIFP